MKRLVLITMVVLLSSSIAFAQDFCKGDFNYDGNVDADDVQIFLDDFGRSIYNDPCPPDGPAPVPRTGQTWTYAPGDDADLLKGVEWPVPRFTDNGDGTVKDNLTGLIWLKDANCSMFNAPKTWYDAIDIIIPQLEDGYCGLSDGSSAGDWRLPNLFELESLYTLYHFGGGAALPDTIGTGRWTEGDPFQNVQAAKYWTSTNFDIPFGGLNIAWFVAMNIPRIDYDFKTITYYVWPVRGGYPGTTTTTVPPTTTTSTIPPLCDETSDCGEGYCCGYASVIEVESGNPLYCTPKTNDAICFFCESQSDCTYSTVYTCCCSECPTVLPPASFCINQISCLLGCESTCVP